MIRLYGAETTKIRLYESAPVSVQAPSSRYTGHLPVSTPGLGTGLGGGTVPRISSISTKPVIPSPYSLDVMEQLSGAGKFLAYHPKIAKTALDIQETQKAFVRDPLGQLAEAGKAAYSNAEDTAANLIRTWQEMGRGDEMGAPAVNKVANAANFLMQVISLPFSGLGDLMAAADKLPVTREAAKMINFPFEMIGRGSNAVVPAAINALPISNASRNALIQPIADLVSFAGQIALPVAGTKILGKPSPVSIKLYPEEPLALAAPKAPSLLKAPGKPELLGEGVRVPQPIPSPYRIKRPTIPFVQRRAVAPKISIAVGDVVSHPEVGIFKVIDKGKVVTPKRGGTKEIVYTLKDTEGNILQQSHSDLIGFIKSTPVPKGDIVQAYSQIVMADIAKHSQKGREVTPPVARKIARTAAGEAKMVVSPVETTPPVKVAKISKPVEPLAQEAGKKVLAGKPSKIALSIEAKAVEAKLTKGFSEIAGYDPITIRSQAEKATNLIKSDIEGARAIVRGERSLPSDLKGTSLIIAMEEHIKNNPSADLAFELANSRLVSETSAAAQELRLAAERTPDSATARLVEIRKAREEKAGRDVAERKKTAVGELKTATEKINLSKMELSWDRFLNQIVC